ncbi:PH domain-containing protein [Micromonospora krabiensis]|uniref:PH domain-containing protein n=1 Tax=Micromonospora krabiensis TaxID=307121 RepID=A0A1C3N4E1_9ACTN|nr:PH domain-containing protein [Micromonospora krabiensis]SBV27459.1 PH domain-containing protein [Micromonospora krabiensis]
MSKPDTVRFRYNQAIVAASVIAFVGALPLANAEVYLLPVLLVPFAVGVWAWRAGTDADARELRVRALFGQRRILWDQVVELTSDGRGRAVARLDDGQEVALTAVRARDLPRLVSATGETLPGTAD